MSAEDKAAEGTADEPTETAQQEPEPEKTPDQKRIEELEGELNRSSGLLKTANLRRTTWKAITLSLVTAIVAGVIFVSVEPWEKLTPDAPGASQQEFKLAETQLQVAKGTIPLLPPADSDVVVSENFVYGAVFEASRWYAGYLGASGAPGEAPAAIYSLSSTRRDAQPTLCLPQDITNDHPYAFFCADDRTVWLPQVTLRGTWVPQNVGMKDGDIYAPALAAAAAGVYAYNTATIEWLASSGKMQALHRLNDDLLSACLTGVWMGTGRRLSAAATQAAVGAIMRYTEPRLLRHTAQEVSDALNLALLTGRPATCFKAYWPGFASPSPSVKRSPTPQASRTAVPPQGTPSATPSASK